MGFVVVTGVFWFWVFFGCVAGFVCVVFFFIFLSRIGGVSEILSISANHFLLQLGAVFTVFADEEHSNTP